MTTQVDEPSKGTGRTLEDYQRVLVRIVAALALLVLAAWIFQPQLLRLIDPGSATMKANTALCLLALCASLRARRKGWVAGWCSIVAAIAVASLSEYVFGVDLGLDQLMVDDTVTTGTSPAGRMAPATAVSLVLLSSARWALASGRRRTAEVLLTPPLVVSAVALLGYLFQVEHFYRVVAYSTLALPAAVALALMTVAIACSVPGGVLWWLVRHPGAGATLARHMLPVAVVVLPLLGFIPILGFDTDVFGQRFGSAVLVTAAAGVLLVVTAVASRRLDRIDQERLAAQSELRALNEQLRERRDLEWRRAEELSTSLYEERARFQRAVSKIDDLIWTVAVLPDGEIRPEFSSGDATGLFGGDGPEHAGGSRAIPSLVHPDDRHLIEEFDDRIRAGEPGEVELRIIGYDGVVRWVWIRGTPRWERNLLYFDGISTNVTERRQLAEHREHLLALEQEQVAQLRQLNQLREELLATTGHELRTPLAVVLGYAELLLQDEELTDRQRRHLEAVARRARQIALLVEDIFDLAKFSAGLASIDVEPVSLGEAVADAVEEHRASAEAAGLTIGVDLTDVTVAGDPARLRQILDNLLSNAVKYSLPGGHISVTARCEGDTATIAISDGGIGIPDGELEHVFDRMYRATSAKDRDISGTGLGLSVTKALVEAHSGTISVASRPEGGTRFTVAIPVQRGSDPEQPGAPSGRGSAHVAV